MVFSILDILYHKCTGSSSNIWIFLFLFFLTFYLNYVFKCGIIIIESEKRLIPGAVKEVDLCSDSEAQSEEHQASLKDAKK